VPTAVAEFFDVFAVTDSISLQLFLPVAMVGFWLYKVGTSGVAMPKASMNKDNGFILWQDYIGFARIALIVLPKSKAF